MSLGWVFGVGEKLRPLFKSSYSSGVMWYELRLCRVRLEVWYDSFGTKNAVVPFSFFFHSVDGGCFFFWFS